MPQSNSVLAFNDPWHDSSFCLYGDTEIVHIECERFTRNKYDSINPILVFCELFPNKIDEFRRVVFEEAPDAATTSFIKQLVAMKCRSVQGGGYGTIPYGPEVIRGDVAAVGKRPERVDAFIRHLLRPDVDIFFAGHHASHAANAFFSSGFASALTITLDGNGADYVLDKNRYVLTPGGTEAATQSTTGSVFRCEGRRCEPVHYVTDSSLGLAWSRVATHVMAYGFGGEGTLMAMASLGDPQHYRKDFEEIWPWLPLPDGDLDAPSLAHVQKFLVGLRDSLHQEQDCFDVAAALQESSEIRFRNFLARFIGPDDRDLCLAGGTVLNCQMVGKVNQWFPQLRRVFVPPAPYDGGICIGAAQLVFHGEMGLPVRWTPGMPPFAMGPEYSRLNIVGACRSARVDMVEMTTGQALALLAEGKILGWFSGAAESGRRALGHRSIIADPRIPGLKDRLNSQIKHRQWFRPFAPMVLAEEVADWFECEPGFRSPYMSFAVPARQECHVRAPAIVHLDGSARVQTVHRELTPRLHEALREWKTISGIPILLNTSFNEHEPIVETPADALNTMKLALLDGVYFADAGILARPVYETSTPTKKVSTVLPSCIWRLQVAAGSRAALAFLDDPDRIRVAIYRRATNENYAIQLNQTRYSVQAGHKYRLTFRGRAHAAPRDLFVGFSRATSDLGLYRRCQLTPEWRDFSEDFVATSDEDNGRIHFDMGNSDTSVELSAVRLWLFTEAGLTALDRSHIAGRQS
jgi:carbamoyltransferase